MLTKNSLKTFFKHFLYWFLAVRFHNLLIIFTVQFTLVFCLGLTNILNIVFWQVAFASFLSVSAGHIINDFYDVETDAINQPFYVKSKQTLPRNQKFKYYFFANFLAFCLGFCVSWRMGLFFGGFIFLIWLYSHKIKNYPILCVLTAAILPTIPVLSILIYFRYVHLWVCFLCCLAYLFLLLTEIIKPLKNLKGDLYYHKNTVVTKYGIRTSKYIFSTLSLMVFLGAYLLFSTAVLPPYFQPFLLLSFATIPSLVFLLWFKNNAAFYQFIFLCIKMLIFSMVLCFWGVFL